MTFSKKTKWVVIGCIVLVSAVLIACGPILIMRYMRTKWEGVNNYKSSFLLMNISGQLALSKDGVYYLKGDNNLYYVLENVDQSLSKKIGSLCSVLGKVRIPKGNETIEGNKVRLFVSINKVIFNDKTVVYNEKTEKKLDNTDEKNKKRARLRAEINAKLKTRIMFDVIKGKVSSIERIDKYGNKYIAYILTDEFNDKYMLYKEKTDLSVLENKEVACLGRQIMAPDKNFAVVDEITFEIYEVYNANYKKLI